VATTDDQDIVRFACHGGGILAAPLFQTDAEVAATVAPPDIAMDISSSSRNSRIAAATPKVPAAARPQMHGLPMQTAAAPAGRERVARFTGTSTVSTMARQPAAIARCASRSVRARSPCQ
jgi:hypothetical protein